MIRRFAPALASMLIAIGCSSAEAPADDAAIPEVEPGRVQTLAPKPPALDLVGTPDLIVRSDMLMSKWLVQNESFTASDCAAVEGGISAGTHKVVRFTVGTANIGDADLLVGDPQVHYDANDGLFELSSCHGHFHFRHYAKYELVNPATGYVWRAAKQGFCMIDTDRNPKSLGLPDRPAIFKSCGSPRTATSPGVPGFQGVSRGWTDTYGYQLQGQFFVLDGGDGQPPVPPGTYTVRITVNPPFTAAPGEPCPYTDGAGFCHQLPESNYNNNVTTRTVTVN
jgi:hypothetical protein